MMSISCKEVYQLPLISPSTGYLVVEGFINSGNGPSAVTLTRTTKLGDYAGIIYEQNAQVYVEDENNTIYPLYERENGNYISNNLFLNSALKYRIHIRTTDGKEYLSDFSTVKHTPPIDGITWQPDNDGVQIYVNTHDNQNQTKYYRWSYSETWEFHSAYISYLDYDRDPVTGNAIKVTKRSNTDSLYKCWKTQYSTNIILGSTEKLSEDKVFLPIRYIPPQAEELSVLYYIKVQQYALSREAYIFHQQMKKNTEQLGSIFDAQPSELGGNIHCVNSPSETVLGYVDVSEEKEATLFISNESVRPWATPVNCSKLIISNKADSIKPYQDSYIPLQGVTYRGLEIATFDAAPAICVDCRLRGSAIKPDFWP